MQTKKLMSQTSKKNDFSLKKLSIKTLSIFNERVMKSCLKPSRTEITCNFFIKVYWNQRIFEAKHHLSYNRKMFLLSRPQTYWKSNYCFWFLCVIKKWWKICNWIYGNFTCNYENAFQLICKVFATQCFFFHQLKRITINKTTCRLNALSKSLLVTLCML